jgi:peptidoglycan-N-acetylglucosamine deacetylase
MRLNQRAGRLKVIVGRAAGLSTKLRAAVLGILVFWAGAVGAATQAQPPDAGDSPKPGTRRTATDGPSAADLQRYAPAPFEIRLPPALPPIPPRIAHHGPRHEARIALTFDACATRLKSGYDEGVIRVLVEKQVPATLFLGGKWMAEHPEETRFLAACSLFELANHSFLHPRLVELADDRVRQELWWTQVILHSLTGRQARLFRAPYAEIDARVAGVAAGMGLTSIQYDLASGDPDAAATATRLTQNVLRQARNGSIIVMHMNGRGWHTAEALPAIIDELRRRGFSFATVGELIRDPRQ